MSKTTNTNNDKGGEKERLPSHPFIELRHLQDKYKVSVTAICMLLSTRGLQRLEKAYPDENIAEPTLSTLGRIIGVSTAAMTTSMDQLTERGMASREAAMLDRRKFILKIHDKGQEVIDHVDAILGENSVTDQK